MGPALVCQAITLWLGFSKTVFVPGRISLVLLRTFIAVGFSVIASSLAKVS